MNFYLGLISSNRGGHLAPILLKTMKEQQLTIAQQNEFALNKLGYYCKVRTVWNGIRKKNDFKFDIIQYDDDQEVIIQKGQKLFSIGELEAINQRDKVIEYYLTKLK